MTGHLLPGGKPHEIGMPSTAELEIARANRRKRTSRDGDEEELPPEEVIA